MSLTIITNINYQSEQYFKSRLLRMENLLPGFQPYREQIAEFVIKLYHILERGEFSEYLGWSSDNEVVIRQPKKVEEKVLPQFFRHRHLSSFIRQLNMYRFTKVVKLSKEKNYMYFKNPFFTRGSIQDLTRIKRNNPKHKHTHPSLDTFEERQEQGEISLENQLNNQQTQENSTLAQYKTFVQSKVRAIFQILKSVQASHLDAKQQVGEPIARCKELLELNQSQISQNSFLNLEDSKNNTDNMLVSMKYLPNMEQVLFPSSSLL